MRTMIGLMPGPESPPNLLPIAGRKLLTSILRPRMGFDTTSASAPAASAALAMATTSPALGESLHQIGLSVVLRMRLMTFNVCSSCSAKFPPFGSRVGHELLTWRASISGPLTSRALADVTGAEPAGHDLLEGHLAGNAARLADALHQLKQAV